MPAAFMKIMRNNKMKFFEELFSCPGNIYLIIFGGYIGWIIKESYLWLKGKLKKYKARETNQ